MRYYFYWISLLVLALDFITKLIVKTKMNIDDEISIIGNFFLITSHRNRGAAFGILQEQRTFFIIVTVIIVIGLIWYIQMMRKSAKPVLMIGLGLVLGGAVGNFIDRVRFGEVVDFFKFNFGSYTFPIFNIADSAIVIGVGLIMLDTLLGMKEEKARMRRDDGKEQEDHEQQTV
ncbi:signal peptidase II [Paenibacillus chungangensis]|uniref:Lipoprotein signal peptidase n=1 Tax=Paenibacillus chungangensis TaxID=696535 RepID=A0ABW3HRW9_9BACL